MLRLDYHNPDISKSVGVSAACLFGKVSQDLKQQTISNRYPAFFLYVAKKRECFILGLGI